MDNNYNSERKTAAAIAGPILSSAFTFMTARILEDSERLFAEGRAASATHLQFGESILKHCGEHVEIVPILAEEI